MSLADTTFSTGVDEKLTAVDVYAVSTSIDATAMLPDAPTASTSLSGMLGGNQGDTSNLIEGLDEEKNLVLNADGLKSNLICSMPSASGILSGIDPGINSSLISGGGLSSIAATVNGITSLVSKANLSSLKGLGELIGTVSGSPFPITLKDAAGLVSLGSGLINQANKLGIPGAYTQISSGMVNSGDIGLLSQITQNVLPMVVSRSNLSMLSEIANGPLGKQVIKLMPNVVGQILGSMKLNPGPAQRTPVQTLKKAHSAFNAINPNWNLVKPVTTRMQAPTTAGTVRASASLVLKASPAAKSLYQSAAAAKIIPVVIRPTVKKVQPASLVPDPTIEFPTGTTSTSQSNPNGSTTTIFTTLAGLVANRTSKSPSDPVITVYEYPAQPIAAPVVSESEVSCYLASSAPVNYDVNHSYENKQVTLDTIPVDPSEFDLDSYGSGAYAMSGSVTGGQVTTIHTSNGSNYSYTAWGDGSTTTEKMENTDPNELPISDPPVAVDMFSNWSAATASDDIAMQSCMIDVDKQARADEYVSGSKSYFTQDANSALTMQFPETYLGPLDA